MVSPNSGNPARYHRIDKFVVPSVVIGREPLSTDIKDPKTGKYYERPHFWLISKNPTTGTEGDLWYLANITANVADWKKLAAGTSPGGGLISLTPDDGVAVFGDAAGDIDVQGKVVANATNAKPLYNNGTPASNLIEFELQVGAAITGAPANSNKAGIVSFDDTQFAVDANGYVTLAGGSGLPVTQTLTGDSGGAVGPDGSGDIDIQGSTVANATNAKPVHFKGTPGSNLIESEVQVGAAITGAPADKNDAGLISADDTQFTIDTNGYLQLKGSGGGAPTLTLTADDTNTVSPDGTGTINVTGTTVANATNAKPVFTDGATANTLGVETQVATALGSAPSDKNDAGLASFDSADFTVSTHGFVQLANGGTSGPGNLYLFDDLLAIGVDTEAWPMLGWDGFALSINPEGDVSAGHPGIFRIQTSSVLLGRLHTSQNNGTSKGQFVLGGGTFTISYMIKLSNLSDGTDNFEIFVGLSPDDSSTYSSATDSVGFLYNHATNSGNWVLKSKASSTDTSANSSTAVGTDWVKLTIEVNSAATSVAYKVDDVEVSNSPITSNIPTVVMAPLVYMNMTAGSATRKLLIDYCEISYSGLSRL